MRPFQRRSVFTISAEVSSPFMAQSFRTSMCQYSAGVTKAFADDRFDYVINLCGETRFGLPDEVCLSLFLVPSLFHFVLNVLLASNRSISICVVSWIPPIQSIQQYKQKSFDPAVKCATAAAAMGVKKFVEVSTAHVYKSDDVRLLRFASSLSSQSAVNRCR